MSGIKSRTVFFVDTTEAGEVLRLQAGDVKITVEGLREQEAESLGEAALTLLAKIRNRLPSRIADRTPAQLVRALDD